MTLDQLGDELTALGYPVAYSHFVETEGAPVPGPPFVCYLVTDSDTYRADNKVLKEYTHVDIELYVKNKNLGAEQAIKSMLNEKELPWSYDEIFIKSEGVFKCTFSITLIN